MSNLIKYQFVNLKADDKFLVEQKLDDERFVPLKQDPRVIIRPLEEVEKEKKEREIKKREQKRKDAQKEFKEITSKLSFENPVAKIYEKSMQEAAGVEEGEELTEDGRKMVEEAEKKAESIVKDAEAEAEQIRQTAYEEGTASGRKEGMELAAHEIDELRAQMEGEAAEREREYSEMVGQLEPRYVEVLCSLVQKLTGVLLSENRDILLHLIRSGMADMDPASRFSVRVCPEDALVVESRKGEIAEKAGDVVIEIQEDKGLAKDECIIESDHQMVDCGFKTQLENMITALRMLA